MGLNINPLFQTCIKYQALLISTMFAVIVFSILIHYLTFYRMRIIVMNDSHTFISVKLKIIQIPHPKKKMVDNRTDSVILDLKISITKNFRVIKEFPVIIKISKNQKTYYTVSQSVRSLLMQAGIPFGKSDRVVPDLDSVVMPHQQITIRRLTSKIVIQTVILKPETEYYHNSAIDYQYISGHAGEVWRWFNIVYQDGVEIKRVLLKEKIIKVPFNNIVLLNMRRNSRFKGELSHRYTFQSLKCMEATAYYPGPECTGKYAIYGLTYTGKKAGYGLVAVDPRVIPLGTTLYVEGYGYAEAADIGGAIKGNKIDLCFNTYREAKEYGRKKIKVCIFGNTLKK
jgi:3D (Asp-Asp-Asp) domain-containing protein